MLCAFLILPDVRRGGHIVLLGVLLLLSSYQCLHAAATTENSVEITDVIVNRVNIFNREQATANTVYRIANRLHRTTTEQAILRELGVVPGNALNHDCLLYTSPSPRDS